jgi:hypothetical protein
VTTFDEGKDALASLASWASQRSETPRNEASTRFHIIDRLLKECLGWVPEDIAVERYNESTYTDYELGRPAAQLVVEAKREGTTFVLPAGSSGRLRLRTVAESSAALGEAIAQATHYAQNRGIPLAAVANGDQLVVFVGSRSDGVPPADGECVAYESFDDMLSRFVQLWDFCSQAGVAARRGVSQLEHGSLPTAPARLSQRLPDYPGFKNRNPVAAELQVLGGAFIEDIIQDQTIEEEFLRVGYCESGALAQYALVAREVLQARYSAFFDKEVGVASQPVSTKDGISEDLVHDVLASSLSKRPIVLLGDVGVGKTTFVRHFVRVEAADVMRDAIFLYVDFGREPALTDDLRSYVRDAFTKQLRDDYEVDIDERNFVRGVYHGDLRRFASGIYADLAELDDKSLFRMKEIEYLEALLADREEHLRKSLEHIEKARKRQVVVFLDNVDQRAPAFQDEVFLIAESLASSWPVTAFVALRPETFQRSKVEGALSGYQPRVFTIHPPRIDRVLQRRIAFARQQLSIHGSLPGFPTGVSLQSERLDLYLSMLQDALTNNDKLIEFIENLSGGSVRRALELVMRFVGSGHVNNSKILSILDASGRYTLPLHEFLRAVAIGDNEHYDPSTSPLANMFDISSDDGTEHFLLPNVISLLLSAGGADEGYVSTSSLYTSVQNLGFKPAQIDGGISRAVRFRLVETYPRVPGSGEVRDAIRIRVTTAGAYMVKRLAMEFSYVDAVIVDTPIVHAGYREKIRDEQTISGRLARAREFIAYLDGEYEALQSRTASGPFDWLGVRQQLLSSVEDLEARLGIQQLSL